MTDRQRIEQIETLITDFAIKQDKHTAILEEHSAKLKRIELQIKRLEEGIKVCLKGIQQNSDDIQFLLRKQAEFEEKLDNLKNYVNERFDKIENRLDNVETKLDLIINILQNRN